MSGNMRRRTGSCLTVRPGTGRAAARAAGRALLAVVTLAALAGCGIRATSVPVDAGPAPSRVSCAVPDATASSRAGAAANRMIAQIALVCSAQIATVTRAVPDVRESRLDLARRLLAELRRRPHAAEAKAGFSTEVPRNLGIDGPGTGDPAQTLRLTQRLADLPSFVLGQIVCTLAGTTVGDADHTIVLGGPDDEPPKRYTAPVNSALSRTRRNPLEPSSSR